MWGGLCPPQLGVWGLAARKKNQFCAKNYAILSKFWYFFPTLQQKVGDYPPVLKVGDLSPCPPPFSDACERDCSYIAGYVSVYLMTFDKQSKEPQWRSYYYARTVRMCVPNFFSKKGAETNDLLLRIAL